MLQFVQFLILLAPILVYGQAVDFERQAITVALTQEPPMLNSIRSTDLVSFFILGHTTEGLLRYDRKGRLVPGVAESWKIYPDRLNSDYDRMRAGPMAQGLLRMTLSLPGSGSMIQQKRLPLPPSCTR